MEIVNRKIVDLIAAEYNPRELTKDQFKQLKDSLTRFGVVDPVIVSMHKDRKNIIVGGHQRCKVWEAMGNKEIPTVEVKLDFVKEKELNVRLNKNQGQWDFDALANFFEVDELETFGFTKSELKVLEDLESDEQEMFEPEVEFSEFMDESSNYVVLVFKNDIDWLSAQTHFDLKTVQSKRANGKPWSKGIGRVINGANYLKSIKE